MHTNEKQYYAFISYKRDDQKWAEWLQEKLEHYKLPTNLNGRSDLPKEIRPVFRDKSELAAGVLADEIQKALDNSKYLIVICSPHSAKSEWVNKEVQAFIESGRTDKIIPFIIEGVPNSNNDETECFPKAIRELPAEDELLGVNINEMGRDAAAVKVVAQMFGLRFDDLWQRHEREQRRKRFMTIGAALMLALIGIGVAVGFSRQNKRISEQNDKIVLQNEEISKKNDEVSKQNAEISRKNEEITLKNDEVLRQNEEIVSKNSRLQNDSLIMAAQLDSINKRDKLIIRQQDSIRNTNKNLETANEQLENERDNLAKTIWKMKEKESRVMAKEVIAMAEENSYTAQKIALEILPKDLNNPVDRPYTPEAEQALRNACGKTNVVFKYPNDVIFVSFGDDNRKIISATAEAVYVTDSYDGRELFKKNYNGIMAIDLSEDKRQIAVACDSVVEIVDLETGNLLQKIDLKQPVLDMAFTSNENKVVSITEDSVLRVWNTKTNSELFSIKDVYYDDLDAKTVVFSPNGKQFVYVVSKEINETGFYGMEYSKTLFLSRNSKNTFCIVDSETGKVLNSWKGHYDLIASLTYSPDGKKIVSTSYDRNIIVWNAETGKKLCSMKWKKGSVATSACFGYDGKTLFTSHVSGYIKWWELDTGKEIFSWKGHNNKVNAVDFNTADDILVSGSLDATMKIWYSSERAFKSKILARVFNFDEAFIGKDKKTIYSLTQRSRKHTTLGEYTIADDKTNIIDNNPGNEGYLHLGDVFVTAVFSQDFKYFIAVPDGYYNPDGLNVYNLNTKEIVCTLKGHEDFVHTAVFSPDCKRVITSSNDGTTRIWDLKTGKEIKRYDREFLIFEYSLDMNKIAVVAFSNNKIFVNDAEKYNTIMVFDGHSAPVSFVRFLSDDIVASHDANKVTKIWNYKTGEVLHTFKGCMCAQNPTISDDGRYFITQTGENKLSIWDMNTDGCVYTIETESNIHDFAFADEGDNVVVVCYDGYVFQYDFPPLQDLIDQTRERFKNRPLTEEERKMYYLE